MKKEIWYHATTCENSQKILADNQLKISQISNGNFLGRGIYFGNTLDIVQKYGQIIFECEIIMDRILFSGKGKEILSAKEQIKTPSNARTGDLLKSYFLANNYKGVNFPADRSLDYRRKLVIYDTQLITIKKSHIISKNF